MDLWGAPPTPETPLSVHLRLGEVESQIRLNLYLLMDKDIEQIFMYLLALCTSFDKCLF